LNDIELLPRLRAVCPADDALAVGAKPLIAGRLENQRPRSL
jgi:hypothetical protein